MISFLVLREPEINTTERRINISSWCIWINGALPCARFVSASENQAAHLFIFFTLTYNVVTNSSGDESAGKQARYYIVYGKYFGKIYYSLKYSFFLIY